MPGLTNTTLGMLATAAALQTVDDELAVVDATCDATYVLTNHVNNHFHRRARWWGALAAPDETNAIEANVNRPFVAISGANTWGAAIPIMGTADVAAPAPSTIGMLHRLLVVDTDHTTPYRIRIIYGTGTSGAAITAGQYTEAMFITSGGPFLSGTPVDQMMPMFTIGTDKLWAQVWNATNLSEVDFFYECTGDG